jgi:Flp pilus assembly CpaE family ATPase
VPGLKSARRIAVDMREVFGGEVQPKVIVNKFSQSFFGATLSANEAKELLGSDLAGFVGAQDSLVREAIDRGVPTTAVKPRNAVVADLGKIIGV